MPVVIALFSSQRSQVAVSVVSGRRVGEVLMPVAERKAQVRSFSLPVIALEVW